MFAFFDLVLALDLQLQWTQSSMQPLPIVVCHDDERHRTAAAWQHLPAGRRNILIAQAADPRVFRQAQLANARVFIAADLVRRVASKTHKMGILASARRYAEPWPTVLRRHLLRFKPDEAAAFLDQIQLPPDAWAEFLTKSDSELIQHLHASSQPQRFAPRAHLGNEIVVERDGGWFLDRTGKRICDAVSVDEILCKHDGSQFLRGSIAVAGQSHPFLVPHERARRIGLLNCLREHFREQGWRLKCRRHWSKRILDLALQMHPAVTVPDADVVGWRGRVFSWPQFGINFQGICVEARTPLVDDHTPAQNLLLPAPLQWRQLRPITLDCPDVNRFWAVLIAMAYIALAPALKNPPIGIVLAGNDGPNLAAAICATFGCREWKTPQRIDARKPYDQFNRALAQTRWPVVVRPQVRSLPAVCHVLAGLDPVNCFIPVADILAAPPARTAGWHVIHAEDAQAYDRVAGAVWR